MKVTMSNSNPIILIDDDKEDIELYQEALKELGLVNEILAFDEWL